MCWPRSSCPNPLCPAATAQCLGGGGRSACTGDALEERVGTRNRERSERGTAGSRLARLVASTPLVSEGFWKTPPPARGALGPPPQNKEGGAPGGLPKRGGGASGGGLPRGKCWGHRQGGRDFFLALTNQDTRGCAPPPSNRWSQPNACAAAFRAVCARTTGRRAADGAPDAWQGWRCGARRGTRAARP